MRDIISVSLGKAKKQKANRAIVESINERKTSRLKWQDCEGNLRRDYEDDRTGFIRDTAIAIVGTNGGANALIQENGVLRRLIFKSHFNYHIYTNQTHA